MAPRLHDPAVRDSLRARVQKLTPDARRQWGKMSVDQMLWHCNQTLLNSLGQKEPSVTTKVPIPMPLLKFMVFSLPWMKGAPTHPDFVAGERHDFAAQREQTLALIDDFTKRSLESQDWGQSGAFGNMTGDEWSRLQAKHLDHHLKQFGS